MLGGHRREEATDDQIGGQIRRFVESLDIGFVAGRNQGCFVAVLAVLVGSARVGETLFQPVLEESTQGSGPGPVLQPQWFAVGHDGNSAAGTQQGTQSGEQRFVVHPMQGLADRDRAEAIGAEERAERR